MNVVNQVQDAPSPALFRPTSLGKNPRPLVFVAEDDPDLRRQFCDALRDAGYDVLSASTGHEMMKLLSAASSGEVAPPDALVIDVRMPRCSGMDVLMALRLAEWPQPVVMITAFGDPILHEKAAAQGASVSLDKPVDTDDLIDIIDVLLAKAREADEEAPVTLRCP